jgi:hypothetical protein
MNSRHSEVTKGTVEQVFVNSTPFKQREGDNTTTIKALFDIFKEKVEYEISNLLAKLTKQDETQINRTYANCVKKICISNHVPPN